MCNGCEVSWWFYVGAFVVGAAAGIGWWKIPGLTERSNPLFIGAGAYIAFFAISAFTLISFGADPYATFRAALTLLILGSILCFAGLYAGYSFTEKYLEPPSRYRINP